MQKAKKNLLIIGAGFLQSSLIEAGKERGFQVIAVDANETAYSANLADIFIHFQFTDLENLILLLKERELVPNLVATCGTDFSWVAARISEYFQIPGPVPIFTDHLTHKGRMRDFFGRYQIAQPGYKYSCSKEELIEWARENKTEFGFVVKPVLNMGARGVIKIPDYRHLAYAFEFAARMDKSGEVIIEDYIPAREYSTDSLVFQGQHFLTGFALRDIQVKDDHYFIERGHTMPSPDYLELQSLAHQFLQKICDALYTETGIHYHGALKGDLRLDNQQNWIAGEVAARLSGGFMSTHTFPSATGISLMHAYLELLEGSLPEEIKNIEYGCVAIERSIAGSPGVLQKFEWREVDALKKNKHSKLILKHQNYQPGDFISELQNNIGKLAHTVFTLPKETKPDDYPKSVDSWAEFEIDPWIKDRRIIERRARKVFSHKHCWVCKVCDGENCASGVPGMGGRGNFQSFRDNLQALEEYRIMPRFLQTESRQEKEPDISFPFLGKLFSAPVLSAPITGAITNMGGGISEWDYAIETSTAAVESGLLPTFGDGATNDKYMTGCFALQKAGSGIPFFKPRADLSELQKRIQLAEQCGALAWGMDIDGISFQTLRDKSAATTRKTVQDLQKLSQLSQLPFLIKGVLTIEDAERSIEAGASGIVISNHGGRVLEGAPGSARVLPEISEFIKARYPHISIFADGGIRSGSDIFKMLALGADAILIGRPIVIAAMGSGRIGVKSLLKLYIDELRQTMRVLGLARLQEISKDHIGKVKDNSTLHYSQS
ncbi:MAG: alpha-hydroxy-acid oxidizing protein [Leptospiraceae bacterium]|nr:alpha-hydroxy-acid oxidizing protein [Leptospiraceae bacterium]MCB1199383.1 alpha-hydroxy-acid oxidizing protein [Leptospiraceae bacterium]